MNENDIYKLKYYKYKNKYIELKNRYNQEGGKTGLHAFFCNFVEFTDKYYLEIGDYILKKKGTTEIVVLDYILKKKKTTEIVVPKLETLRKIFKDELVGVEVGNNMDEDSFNYLSHSKKCTSNSSEKFKTNLNLKKEDILIDNLKKILTKIHKCFKKINEQTYIDFCFIVEVNLLTPNKIKKSFLFKPPTIT
jgi:hypothetical protein